MQALSQKRCFNHVEREAVARCMECRQFFCRECVSEHENRILCAPCQAKVAKKPSILSKITLSKKLILVIKGITGIGLAWFIFWLYGLLVLAMTR